ncbi:MAG: hypothetical protein AAGJ29_11950 [Pseudomonadota bacterium]
MSNYSYQDEPSGRRWIIFLIFLMLIGFIAAGVWFWYTQGGLEKANDPVTIAAAPPELEPLPEAENIDRLPISDEQAVADGTLSRFDDNRWLESESFIGTDSEGRSAALRIYILSQDYAWRFGDGSVIEGPLGQANLRNLFSGGDFQTRFCAADSVLAIGTSSFEGPTRLNHRLARSRGRELVGSLSNLRTACAENGPQLLAASLGEHAETSPCPGRDRCPEATASQRRVILVGVDSATGEVNYDEALWSGMRRFEETQQGFFRDFRLADYDQFEVLN